MSFVMLTRRHREPSIGLEGWPLGQGLQVGCATSVERPALTLPKGRRVEWSPWAGGRCRWGDWCCPAGGKTGGRGVGALGR